MALRWLFVIDLVFDPAFGLLMVLSKRLNSIEFGLIVAVDCPDYSKQYRMDLVRFVEEKAELVLDLGIAADLPALTVGQTCRNRFVVQTADFDLSFEIELIAAESLDYLNQIQIHYFVVGTVDLDHFLAKIAFDLGMLAAYFLDYLDENQTSLGHFVVEIVDSVLGSD